MESRRPWNDIFKVLKEILPTKCCVSGKTIFINRGETKKLPNKQKLREFIMTRSDLQKW